MKRTILIEIEPASGTVDPQKLHRVTQAIERESVLGDTDRWLVRRTVIQERADTT